MFSLDMILLELGTKILAFIVANKFSVFGIFYILEKLALTTKTTVDDSIVTFLKNTVLRMTGKGYRVDDEYKEFKELGLIHTKLDKKTLVHLKDKLGTPKSQNINKYPDKLIVEGPKMNEVDRIGKDTIPKTTAR